MQISLGHKTIPVNYLPAKDHLSVARPSLSTFYRTRVRGTEHEGARKGVVIQQKDKRKDTSFLSFFFFFGFLIITKVLQLPI